MAPSHRPLFFAFLLSLLPLLSGAEAQKPWTEADQLDFLRRHWSRPIPPQGKPPARWSQVEASLLPESCGTCHPTQLADWKESLHARSMGPGVKGQLVELEVQRSKLLKTYKEKHPEVLKVQSQIDEITRKLREEVNRIARSMESEYNVLKAREAAMLAAVNQYRDETQSLAKKEIQYGILKRDAESNQQLYDVLLRRFKETTLSQGLDTNNVRIVEPAAVPVLPVKPRKVLNMALAVVLGLGLGLALAFFIEYMDHTLRTPEQVEKALGLPVLAVIPTFAPRRPS